MTVLLHFFLVSSGLMTHPHQSLKQRWLLWLGPHCHCHHCYESLLTADHESYCGVCQDWKKKKEKKCKIKEPVFRKEAKHCFCQYNVWTIATLCFVIIPKLDHQMNPCLWITHFHRGCHVLTRTTALKVYLDCSTLQFNLHCSVLYIKHVQYIMCILYKYVHNNSTAIKY